TAAVTVSGATAATYTVAIPAQAAANTFSSFLMYVTDLDVDVVVTDVTVVAAGTTTVDPVDPAAPAVAGPWEGFGGALGDNETFTYSVPTGSESWAGFANDNAAIYPFSFANGGTITFIGSVPSGADVNVNFRFERLPHPDVEPSFNTAAVTVSGATEASYSVTIAAQDSANTFSSFLMYLAESDVDVVVKDVTVTSAGGTVTADDSGTDADSGATTPASGELIANGTFENADLAGWAPDGAGSTSAVNTEASGGNFSANLKVGEIQDAIIKAANLGTGGLTQGQSVTVSFDLKAEYSGAGGVIFVQFFHESATEGATNGDGGLGNGLAPVAATSEWQTFTYNDTLDTDVSGGVSLMLKASCGAVAGCGVDAYFDNVSVIVN
ncbi:carbohydrate binding domain-containing protein, partial [Porticoccaceae bacterium]|nr:carbohydrate binding domain-containing protein [Porticoccaceae bacterium]